MKKEIRVENPATNEIYVTLDCMSPEEIDEATVRAHEAALGWKKTQLSERIETTYEFVKKLNDNIDSVSEEITRQMGKPLWQSRKEVGGCSGRALYMADIAESALEDLVTTCDGVDFRKIAFEPKGVILDIASWNYPLMVAVSVIAPAVLAGNAVLIKHSSQTPLCGKVFERLYREAGAPEGLVTAIVSDRESCGRLFESPLVNGVFFTGSVDGGYEVNRRASSLLVDTGLELGGKDPAYVREDADLPHAVAELADASFYNTGQSCCAVERIYVHKSLYERFVAEFLDVVSGYRLGDPMDETTYIGPLTQRKQLAVLQGQTDEAVSRGAELLMGGRTTDVGGRGNYFEPTVLAGVSNDMKVMQDESFGPIIGIMPVQDDEEALRLMNDSRFGLTASVWTSNQEKALALANVIQAGTVYMNRADFVEPELAWTGVKESGKGCTMSRIGFMNVTQPKSYNFRNLGKKTETSE
ncbi:MAG TPA: aldehyde dehydrogenase family protein [bacterium]|nr:aldehyde dehydrogenase family protein [bacterium]